MWFPAALVISTVLTIASIFGVYKFFLEKPQIQPPSPSPQIIAPKALGLNENPAISPTPSVKPTPTPTLSALKPKPSTKSKAGSISVLQNNLSSPSPGSTTGNSTISGTIDLSGTAPSNTTLVIAARQTGSGEQFQVVVDSITAKDDASWSWSGAKTGTRYDMFAVLKGQSSGVNIDYAASPASTVTAPYSSQVLVVDIGYSMSTPTGTITTTCSTHNSDNTWAGTANFPSVSGAKMYHLQIGTTSGASDIVDTKTSNQNVNINLQDSRSYYAQYSVASVSYPTTYQYSSFSTPQIIRCP